MITEMMCRYAVRKNWCRRVAENIQSIRFNSPGYKIIPRLNFNHLYYVRSRLQKVVQRYIKEV